MRRKEERKERGKRKEKGRKIRSEPTRLQGPGLYLCSDNVLSSEFAWCSTP